MCLAYSTIPPTPLSSSVCPVSLVLQLLSWSIGWITYFSFLIIHSFVSFLPVWPLFPPPPPFFPRHTWAWKIWLFFAKIIFCRNFHITLYTNHVELLWSSSKCQDVSHLHDFAETATYISNALFYKLCTLSTQHIIQNWFCKWRFFSSNLPSHSRTTYLYYSSKIFNNTLLETLVIYMDLSFLE